MYRLCVRMLCGNVRHRSNRQLPPGFHILYVSSGAFCQCSSEHVPTEIHTAALPHSYVVLSCGSNLRLEETGDQEFQCLTQLRLPYRVKP